MIRKSEFELWLQDPITKKMIKYVKEIREAEKEMLIDLLGDVSTETFPERIYAAHGGVIKAIDHLLDLDSDMINSFFGEHPIPPSNGAATAVPKTAVTVLVFFINSLLVIPLLFAFMLSPFHSRLFHSEKLQYVPRS